MALVPLTATVATPLFNMTCNAQQRWVASIAPQIGFTWDQAMVYVRSGAAFTREQFSATCNFGPSNAAFSSSFVGQACSPAAPNTSFPTFSNGFSADDFRVGWTVGYGVQFALTRNWSAMAEIDYVDFGSHALAASDGHAYKRWHAQLASKARRELPVRPWGVPVDQGALRHACAARLERVADVQGGIVFETRSLRIASCRSEKLPFGRSPGSSLAAPIISYGMAKGFCAPRNSAASNRPFVRSSALRR